MTASLHPAASHHLPPFVTAPAEVDVLMVMLLALIDFPEFGRPLGRIADTSRPSRAADR